MHGYNSCGGYCYSPGGWSKKDQVALLEEQEKIMEAKLATIRHMKESLAKAPGKNEE